MLRRTKTAHLLVLCLMFNVVSFAGTATNTAAEPEISFDQVDGMHAASSLNLSGDSTVPLTSVEITVWNISQPDQWDLIASSPYLDRVVPYTDSVTELTRWSWEHAFSLDSLDCTCYIEISLLEQTDLISFGLIAYIGDEHHRPVLKHALDTSSSQMYSTKIFNDNSLDLSFNFLLPPLQIESFDENEQILSNVRIVPHHLASVRNPTQISKAQMSHSTRYFQSKLMPMHNRFKMGIISCRYRFKIFISHYRTTLHSLLLLINPNLL